MVRAPMVVWPATYTLAMRRHPSPTITSGPTMQYGPIDAPSPIRAPGATRAVGSIALITGSQVVDDRTEFAFGYDPTGNSGFAAVPPHVLAPCGLGHVVFNGISRIDRLAELRLVDREEIRGDCRSLSANHLYADNAGGLGHAFDQQHAGKYRVARKVALELRLVRGYVLDSNCEVVTPNGDDAIDHQERVSMRNGTQDSRNIDRFKRTADFIHILKP